MKKIKKATRTYLATYSFHTYGAGDVLGQERWGGCGRRAVLEASFGYKFGESFGMFGIPVVGLGFAFMGAEMWANWQKGTENAVRL
jgi:hypothetical protein